MEIKEDVSRILEIPKILNVFASSVRGELGLLRAGSSEAAAFAPQLAGTDRALPFVHGIPGQKREWPWNPALSVFLSCLRRERSGMLSGEELLSVARLLTLANVTREILAKSREQYPAFEPLSAASGISREKYRRSASSTTTVYSAIPRPLSWPLYARMSIPCAEGSAEPPSRFSTLLGLADAPGQGARLTETVTLSSSSVRST